MVIVHRLKGQNYLTYRIACFFAAMKCVCRSRKWDQSFILELANLCAQALSKAYLKIFVYLGKEKICKSNHLKISIHNSNFSQKVYKQMFAPLFVKEKTHTVFGVFSVG